MSSTPTPMSSRAATPAPEGYETESNPNIYPDVVAWNPEKLMYVIDAEVKSGDRQRSIMRSNGRTPSG